MTKQCSHFVVVLWPDIHHWNSMENVCASICFLVCTPIKYEPQVVIDSVKGIYFIFQQVKQFSMLPSSLI